MSIFFLVIIFGHGHQRCTYYTSDGIFDVKSKEGRAFYSRKGWFLLLNAYVCDEIAARPRLLAFSSISNVRSRLALSKSLGPISKNLLCCGGRLEWMIFPQPPTSFSLNWQAASAARCSALFIISPALYRYGSPFYISTRLSISYPNLLMPRS